MIIEFEDCTLNTRTRMLCKRGAPLHLQPKVMDLLIVLVENHQRYVPKDELVAALWPEVRVSHASLIRVVHILRAALREDHANPRLIRTLHCRGYQWIGGLRETLEAGSSAFAQRAI